MVSKKIPIFEEWLKDKRFISVLTNKTTNYFFLPIKQKLAIKNQYEIFVQQLNESIKLQIQQKKISDKQRRLETKNLHHPNHNWTEKQFLKEIENWKVNNKSLIEDKDSDVSMEDIAVDVAKSFLHNFPSLKNLLLNKFNVDEEYFVDYIADFLVD